MVQAVVTDADTDENLTQEWLLGKSDSTKDAYARDIEQFYEWMEKEFDASPDIDELTVLQLKKWGEYLESRYAKATAYRKLIAVKSLLTYAYETGYLHKNPGKHVEPCSLPNKVHRYVLSRDQVEEFLDAASSMSTHHYLVILTLYGLGLRSSEIARLTWSDLVPQNRRIHIRDSKGGKHRIIPVPDQIWSSLQDFRSSDADREDRIFDLEDRFGTYKVVREVLKESSLDPETYPVSPHWFRHTHATHAINGGAPIHLIKVRLGHSTIETTETYLHAKDESTGEYLELIDAMYARDRDQSLLSHDVEEMVEQLKQRGVSKDEVLEMVDDAFDSLQ